MDKYKKMTQLVFDTLGLILENVLQKRETQHLVFRGKCPLVKLSVYIQTKSYFQI